MVRIGDILVKNQKYRELRHEVDRLSVFVKAAGSMLPKGVYKAFRAYEKSQEARNALPSVLVLNAARDAFYAMPAALQREALNGWKPAPRLPDRRRVLKAQEYSHHVCRTLRLVVRQRDGQPPRILVDLGDGICEDGQSVLIFVKYGTPDNLAVQALRMAAATLDCSWKRAMEGEYIAGQIVEVTERNGTRKDALCIDLIQGGMPDLPLASKLAGKSERAKSTAAALA